MDTDQHSDKYYNAYEHGTPDEYADLDAYTDAVSLAHAYRSYRDTHSDSIGNFIANIVFDPLNDPNRDLDAGTYTDQHADL
jgi:hypothetical protein